MMSAIEKAEHFIYIENQFFISSSSPIDSDDLLGETLTVSSKSEIAEIRNKIGRALVNKVIQAHR